MIGLFLGRPRKGSNARRINSCSTSYSSNNRLKGRGLSLMSLVYAQGGKQTIVGLMPSSRSVFQLW
jgi:hypothetical protein